MSAEHRRDEVLRALDPRRVDDHVRGAELLQEPRACRRGARRRASSRWRNSTSISSSPSCSRAHCEVVERAGPCRRRTRETGRGSRRACRPQRSGSSAARNRRKTSPRNSRDGRSTRPRSSTGASSRRSGGSASSLTGCRVISPNALTCITNPSGVRSAQRCDHLLARQPVVGRVDLDRVEVLGVVREPLAGLHARRVPVLRERVVGPRARADADRRHPPSIRLRASPAGGADRDLERDLDGLARDLVADTVASMHGYCPGDFSVAMHPPTPRSFAILVQARDEHRARGGLLQVRLGGELAAALRRRAARPARCRGTAR